MAHQTQTVRPLWLGSILYLVCFMLSAMTQFEGLVLAKGSNYYTAAVFEHVRYDGGKKFTPPHKEIQKNLHRYSVAARTAAEQKSDIIVFPEWGLYNSDNGNLSTLLQYAEDVPDPSDHYWNPCANQSLFKDRPILQHLSCLAKDNGLFLVANIADVKNCIPEDEGGAYNSSEGSTECPPDGRKFFNTNVVFNREGTLVTRYYKIHLYYEPEFSVPTNPELAFFETDFGLFTTFVCFDISYREAVDAVERKDVLNVAFPTYWFDTLPFMSSIQFHQAFALTNRVNLLAANVHYPGWGTIGSGIYSGTTGARVYTFNPDGKAKLLVSRVPIEKDQDFDTRAKIFRIGDRGAKDITNKKQDSKVPKQCSTKILGPPKDYNKDYRCEEMNTTSYSFKKLVQSTGSLGVCQKGLCCNLSYTADSMKEDFYLGAFNGIDMADDTFGFCEENCILIRCDKGDGTTSCSTYPLITSTRFRNFKLSGTFATKYVYPSLMKSKMRLSSTDDWKFLNGNGQAQITYEPKSKRGDLIRVAGLYGRCYDRDP